MTRLIFVLAALALLGSGVSHADVITTFDYPGTTEGTSITGVSGNTIVGNYSDFGFVYNNGTYSQIYVPGSEDTLVTGISGNNIVGTYTTSNPSGGTNTQAFVYNGGNYTTITAAGTSNVRVTGVCGNTVIGYSNTAVNPQGDTGFQYNTSTSTFSVINPTGSQSTYVLGISGSNLVGYYVYNNGNNISGYVYNGTTYSNFTSLSGSSVIPTAISGNTIAGSWNGFDGSTSFVYQNGVFTSIVGSNFPTPPNSFPGTPGIPTTDVTGVWSNNVVGVLDYTIHGGQYTEGFLYDSGTGTSTTIAIPGAYETWVSGIDGNNIYGYYTNYNGDEGHGFEYTIDSSVPEPSSLILLALPIIGMLLYLRRRRVAPIAT